MGNCCRLSRQILHISARSIDLLHNPLCLEKSEILLEVFRNRTRFRIPEVRRLEKSRQTSGIKICNKRTILISKWGYARGLINKEVNRFFNHFRYDTKQLRWRDYPALF